MDNEFVTLSNGVEIPQLGFGVFQIPPEETKDVVKKAIEVGYRHFDTAQAYFNEAEIGEAINVSESRISQLHAQAIMKLKNLLSENRSERLKRSII